MKNSEAHEILDGVIQDFLFDCSDKISALSSEDHDKLLDLFKKDLVPDYGVDH